ncbi:MAG: 6-bladed beta-propeller [Bacteroidetes bacterium]|jgi:hypothetical protein|nr:6-bladed beta-propeller [Bacteroidota bacterium]
MVSCAGENDESANPDSYVNFLSMQIPEAGTAGIRVIETPSVYNPGSALRWSDRFLVIANAARNSLELLRIDGTFISSAGGRGRGPGEFEVINQLHRGSDDHLYVLDRIQSRISKFRVQDGELLYIRSFSPEVPDQNLIEEIVVTDAGPYVLYNHTDDYSSGENSYHFYKTDEQFNPVEFLFEIEGSEKIRMGRAGHIDHPLARQSLWAIDENYFYTLNSHHTAWKKRDLRSSEADTFTILNDTVRPNSENSITYLEQRMEPVINAVPAVGEAIHETEELPLHHSFFIEGNWAIITGFYAGGTKNGVIIHSLETKKTVYADVPPHFFPFSFDGDALFGINKPSEEQMEITVVEIEW